MTKEIVEKGSGNLSQEIVFGLNHDITPFRICSL